VTRLASSPPRATPKLKVTHRHAALWWNLEAPMSAPKEAV
jgi:hypothetical protein